MPCLVWPALLLLYPPAASAIAPAHQEHVYIHIHLYFTQFPTRTSGALQQTLYGSRIACPVLDLLRRVYMLYAYNQTEMRQLQGCPTLLMQGCLIHGQLISLHTWLARQKEIVSDCSRAW